MNNDIVYAIIIGLGAAAVFGIVALMAFLAYAIFIAPMIRRWRAKRARGKKPVAYIPYITQ